MSKMREAIQSVLSDCMRLRRNESLLILVDPPYSTLGYAFYQEALRYSKKPSLIILPPITNHNCEPSKDVASYMLGYHVIILLTSRSLSHTQARRKACQRGARIASLPSVTEETLIRTMTGDYRALIDKSRKVADIFTIGHSAHLTTPAGTDLTYSISRMRGYADTGMIHESGQFSNLPAGEACAAPVHMSSNGVLVIDGSFPGVGLITTPVHMAVKNGQVVRITGQEDAVKIRKLLRPYGKSGRTIGEVGVGTNAAAKVTDCVLEAEKALGTAHVALGNNISFGGKVSVACHFDGVILNPTMVIDGKTILEKGVYQV